MAAGSMAFATATAYGIGTLFSNLAQFFSERASNQAAVKQATIDEYLEWLRRKDQQQLAALITGNSDLMEGVKVLLQENQTTIVGMLQRIDTVVGSMAASMEMFRAIVESKPFAGTRLSESSLGILSWLSEGGFSGFLVINARGDDITLVALGGRNPGFIAPAPKVNYDVLEPRFFQDDAVTLVELGLLRESDNGKGESVYHLTREGERVAKEVAQPASPTREAP